MSNLSEISKKNEILGTVGECSKKAEKQKNYLRKGRSRKSSETCEINADGTSIFNLQIVQNLSKPVIKNESETSVKTNQPNKIPKESPKIQKMAEKQYNCKRRKSKKSSKTCEINADGTSIFDAQVVQNLSKPVIKNESETSVETNPPNKIAKESPITQRVYTKQNKSHAKCDKNKSGVQSHLNKLFKNLEVSNQNVNEYINVNLLKKNNLGFFHTGSVEQLSVSTLSNTKKKGGLEAALKSKQQDTAFNLNNHQTCSMIQNSNRVETNLRDLLPELDGFLNLSFKETITNRLKNVNSDKSQSFQIKSNVSTCNQRPKYGLEYSAIKNMYKNENIEKFVSLQLKCESHKKRRTPKINSKHQFINDSILFDGNQKVFVNSELQRYKDTKRSPLVNTPNLHKTRKKQNSVSQTDDSSPTSKEGFEFPEYMSADELKEMSDSGALMSGIIRINQKNYKEAYINAPDKGMDILIEGLKDRNRALEGDEVFFMLKPKEQHKTRGDSIDIQRTAIVVAIKAINHNRGAIGTLNTIKKKNVNFALFSPRDMRLPRIRIRKNNWPEGFSEESAAFKEKLYFARITRWTDLRFAEGKLIEEVGLVGDIESETKAILLNYDLNTTPYKESLKRYIPTESFALSETEIKAREDLREECIFTIDPVTAVDLDDAISCKRLKNGNYEVGVHISDVTHYLKEGTPLDLAISERATTVYLVQRAYHMLPFELCRQCSLTPGEDKLSFSVFWEVTPDFKIIDRRFARTVINSCAQFSYAQIQTIINGVPLTQTRFPSLHGGHSIERIEETIKFLHRMTSDLRAKRFDSGALRINQRKIKFSLDDSKLPVNFAVEIQEESQQLIEELMLLANITVAEKLHETFPEIAFLRSHSPPVMYVLQKLQKTLEKYNIELDIATSGSIHTSLKRFSGDDAQSVAQILVLNNLVAKPMTRATYYCSGMHKTEVDRHHYALNVPIYTHFTSPIRRYADIMVHRLLSAAVSHSNAPQWSIDHVSKIAENCNKQKYAAKLAGEMSIELFFSVYIQLQGSFVCDAVVCDVKDRSFDCIVISTGTHLRVYFERINAELEQTVENGIPRLLLKWPIDETHTEETIQIIQMFSVVRVKLNRANALKIEATLLR